MGAGDKNHLNFHIHFPHLQFHHHHHHQVKKELKDIPKGYLAILVGQGDEQEKFLIPVIYINHPLFIELLKVAEEEYGFDQKGPIAIPCHVEEFRNVQGMIDRESSHQDHHQQQHQHHILCFRV